ncbi:CVNH domain-containing protein [Bradyrhizobium mercantei]|uniref:CVNH domain-containing protein n=1 Tax=Bradyrhizobium mercantei TaxID=1904807 RepID=UPI000976EF56|nr:CVNH domain-containing protein [Bradyrhizobium mercantei]
MYWTGAKGIGLLKAAVCVAGYLTFQLSGYAEAQPAGSYQKTCRNSRIENNALLSSCRDKNGHYHDTSLAEISRCSGEVSNDNGSLRCSSYGALPAGTYQQTCRNSRVDNDTLYGSCMDSHGGYHDTSLAQVSHCNGSSILNDNGTLRCSTDGAAPAGSYSKSCGRVRTDNGTLLGECRKIGGGDRAASLQEYKKCWSGTDILNVDGYLSCEKGDQPSPVGSYKATCRDPVMTAGVLSAQCLNYHRDFKPASLNVSQCRQPIENHDGHLSCGHVAQKPVPAPAQGFSAVEVFNCQTSRRLITVWAIGSDQRWDKKGQVDSSYVDNLCPGGPPGLVVQLTPGPNVIRALDPTQCNGADDPQNFNCRVDELTVTGLSGGPVAPYPVGNF